MLASLDAWTVDHASNHNSSDSGSHRNPPVAAPSRVPHAERPGWQGCEWYTPHPMTGNPLARACRLIAAQRWMLRGEHRAFWVLLPPITHAGYSGRGGAHGEGGGPSDGYIYWVVIRFEASFFSSSLPLLSTSQLPRQPN